MININVMLNITYYTASSPMAIQCGPGDVYSPVQNFCICKYLLAVTWRGDGLMVWPPLFNTTMLYVRPGTASRVHSVVAIIEGLSVMSHWTISLSSVVLVKVTVKVSGRQARRLSQDTVTWLVSDLVLKASQIWALTAGIKTRNMAIWN